VSQEFACGHVTATDFERGDAVAESTSGQTKAFPFDVATMTIRDQTIRWPRLFTTAASRFSPQYPSQQQGISSDHASLYNTV
jgi:hypothetical protein